MRVIGLVSLRNPQEVINPMGSSEMVRTKKKHYGMIASKFLSHRANTFCHSCIRTHRACFYQVEVAIAVSGVPILYDLGPELLRNRLMVALLGFNTSSFQALLDSFPYFKKASVASSL